MTGVPESRFIEEQVVDYLTRHQVGALLRAACRDSRLIDVTSYWGASRLCSVENSKSK
jgi:hypothetical protein